jgi:hypothetical protein
MGTMRTSVPPISPVLYTVGASGSGGLPYPTPYASNAAVRQLNFREKFEQWHFKKYGYCIPPQPGYTAFRVKYSQPLQQARWETYCEWATK